MKTIRNNLYILRFVIKFVPLMVLFAFLSIAASAVLAVVKLRLISEAISIVTTSSDISILYESLIIYLIIILVTSFFKIFYTYYISPRYRTIYTKKMQQFLFSRVKIIDMESFDNPEFYDNYSRALRDGVFRGLRVFEDMVRFLTSVAIVLSIGVIIVISDYVLILIILASSILNIFIVNAVNKKWYLWSKETESDRRMYNYVNRTFYRQRFAGEIKTTKISELLIQKYRNSAESINQKYRKTHKKVLTLNSIHYVSKGFLEQGASYIYLGIRLIKGLLNYAKFAESLNATFQFSSNFVDAIQFLVNLRQNSLYIDDFRWLINYEPKVEAKQGLTVGQVDELKIENLGFQYPGSDNFSLSDMNLRLKRGEKIAIVGPNGGGKTTLTKLLLHFYLPTNGVIWLNDKSYEELNSESVRSKYSVVFQDFQIYALTIGENILMRKVESKEDEARIWEALDMVGMKEKVESLEKGIDTQVTREFNRDGAVFSGGEVQRLVIARCFASDADIYILDEPTSSLDPLSEERINKLIIQNTKKAMIIIAHRLSTVVDADKIYLINRGQIQESGTHQELLDANGLYAKMFQTQKSLYEKVEH